MKKTILTSAIGILAGCALAQDIHFTQYNFAPLSVNPALTAAYKNIQGTLHYKQQWKNLNAYRTQAATFEIKMSQFEWTKADKLTATFKQKVAKGLAFGINAFSDKAGDGSMKQFQGNLSVAYHAHASEKSTFSGGIMAGYAQRNISPDALRWNNQYAGGIYDPTLPSGENLSSQSHGYFDFAGGLLWSWGEDSRYLTANDQKFISAGVSLYHLGRPEQSFLGTSDRLNWRWTGHVNTLFGITNTSISLGPTALYTQQGPLRELVLGGLVKYKLKEDSKYTGYVKGAAFSVGGYYRHKDAIAPVFLLEMSYYSIGISYDSNISGLKIATSGKGGVEVVLRFNKPSSFLYTQARFY